MCLWFDSGTGHLVCKDRRDRRDRQDRQDREVKAQKKTKRTWDTSSVGRALDF